MSYDDDPDQGPGASQTNTDELVALKAKLAEFEKDNFTLRDKVRRTDLRAKYGEDIAELVPEQLPPEKWDEFAEKLSALKKPEKEATQAEEAPEEAVKDKPVPEGLKAATGATPSPTQARPNAELTNKQIAELGRTDPVAAWQEIQARAGQSE